jgi:hypothetical protein
VTSLAQRRRRLRRHAVARRLLVGIGELEQRRLAVGHPEERDADREVVAGPGPFRLATKIR